MVVLGGKIGRRIVVCDAILKLSKMVQDGKVELAGRQGENDRRGRLSEDQQGHKDQPGRSSEGWQRWKGVHARNVAWSNWTGHKRRLEQLDKPSTSPGELA